MLCTRVLHVSQVDITGSKCRQPLRINLTWKRLDFQKRKPRKRYSALLDYRGWPSMCLLASFLRPQHQMQGSKSTRRSFHRAGCRWGVKCDFVGRKLGISPEALRDHQGSQETLVRPNMPGVQRSSMNRAGS